MRQRIQFGAAESRLRAAARGAIGGEGTFVVPRFGTRCVCCNADARGRTQRYDPSTDRVEAAPVPMPVCEACADHALLSHFAAIMQASLLCVGGAGAALGVMYLGERPHDTFLWGVIAVGALLVVGAIAWIAAGARRNRRALAAGHHPQLGFSVAHGRTLLDTRNHDLAEELLALNPSAKRLPTPLLWRRAERRAVPPARTVRDDRDR